MVTKGFSAPEVERTYARARDLCQQMGDTPQLFQVLRGLWRFYQVGKSLQTAHALAAQCFSLAQRLQDVACLLEAHEVLGITLYHLGEWVPARTHFEQGMALYDPQQHRSLAFLYGEDPGVACLSRTAHVLWMLGYPEQALERIRSVRTLTRDLSHPFSLGYALVFAALLHYFRQEGQAAQEQAEAAMTLATEHGFAHWLAQATILRGWALAAQGGGAEAITQMRQNLATLRAIGSEVGRPWMLAMLAEAYGRSGQAEPGLQVLAEAPALMDRTGERCWEGELYRLQGGLLLQQTIPDEQQAEVCFQQALAVARRQQAKSLELRVVISLARLLLRQGKRNAAHELLAEVYGWFAEGFDTADLQEARTLLEELTV